MRDYYVYVMTNKSGTLYTGVTNSLERRVSEHKRKLVVGFTSRYGITRLLYYEVYSDVRDAIAREKEIKKWRRNKKLAMVRSLNPLWRDLAEGWYSDQDVVGEGPDPSLRSG